jgi:hypothetical protein
MCAPCKKSIKAIAMTRMRIRLFCAALGTLLFGCPTNISKAEDSDVVKDKLAAFHSRVQRIRCTYVRTLIRAPKPTEQGSESIVKTVGLCAFDRRKGCSRIDETATTSSGRVFRSVKIDNGEEFYSAGYPDGKKIATVMRKSIAESQSGAIPTPPNLLGLGFAPGNLGTQIRDWKFSALGVDKSQGHSLFRVRFVKPGDDPARPPRDYSLDVSRDYVPAAGELGATESSPAFWKFKVLTWGTAKDVATSQLIPFPASIERTFRPLSGQEDVTLTSEITAEINGKLSDDLFTIDWNKLPPGVEITDWLKAPAEPPPGPPSVN